MPILNPRHTAAPIARIRALEGERPPGERLFTDPYAYLFDDASVEVTSMFEQVPFFVQHVRLRTRYIDDGIRSAVEAGVRTIVTIGAGFDSRALRMTEIGDAGARVVEIDHADQIAAKKAILAEARVSVPAHLTFAPADLALPGALASALGAAGVEEGARVHFLCEGLFGYLSPDACRELAEQTGRFAGDGSSLVGNYFLPVWTVEALEKTFDSSAWKVRSGPLFDELYRTHLAGEPPPGGDQFTFLNASR